MRMDKSLHTLYFRSTPKYTLVHASKCAYCSSCHVELPNGVMPEPVSTEKHSLRIEQYRDYNVSGDSPRVARLSMLPIRAV